MKDGASKRNFNIIWPQIELTILQKFHSDQHVQLDEHLRKRFKHELLNCPLTSESPDLHGRHGEHFLKKFILIIVNLVELMTLTSKTRIQGHEQVQKQISYNEQNINRYHHNQHCGQYDQHSNYIVAASESPLFRTIMSFFLCSMDEPIQIACIYCIVWTQHCEKHRRKP